MKNIIKLPQDFITINDENLKFSIEKGIDWHPRLHHSKFYEIYDKIILEHATGLFTPKKLLQMLSDKLVLSNPVIVLNLEQIKKYCNDKSNKLFAEAITNKKLYDNFHLYVLYLNPTKDLNKLQMTNDVKNFILKQFIKNKNLPACNVYYAEKSTNMLMYAIVIINNVIIDNYDFKLKEVHLDHELNHIFERFLNDSIYLKDKSNDKELINEVIKWFKTNKIDYPINDDFNTHMFSSVEFIEMLANVCNWLSLYQNESNKFKAYNNFLSMTKEDFIKSNKFKQLSEPIAGSIIFAFICKKFMPERWTIVIEKVKEQLSLTDEKHLTIKLYLNKISNFLKGFFKHEV